MEKIVSHHLKEVKVKVSIINNEIIIPQQNASSMRRCSSKYTCYTQTSQIHIFEYLENTGDTGASQVTRKQSDKSSQISNCFKEYWFILFKGHCLCMFIYNMGRVHIILERSRSKNMHLDHILVKPILEDICTTEMY